MVVSLYQDYDDHLKFIMRILHITSPSWMTNSSYYRCFGRVLIDMSDHHSCCRTSKIRAASSMVTFHCCALLWSVRWSRHLVIYWMIILNILITQHQPFKYYQEFMILIDVNNKSSSFHNLGVGNTILLGYESAKHLLYQVLCNTNLD